MGISHLQEIVNWGINQRSIEYLEQVQNDLDTFVVTKPYIQALELLHKQYFCVLTGAPKMGKTCTADAIAASYAAEGFSIYELRNQKDFYDIFNKEEKQLFVCDDVFGDIALQADKKNEWTHSLSRLLRSLSNDHKLVWTARSYILKEAIENSKILEDKPDFAQDTVIINVENLIPLEKAMILYNHAKKANLPDQIKTIIKQNCDSIVKSAYFAPESVRQLCTGTIVQFSEDSKDQEEIIAKIFAFLKSPGIAWQKAFKNSPSEVQYICLQLMAAGGNINYQYLFKNYETEVREKGFKWMLFADAFQWSEGSFLKRKQQTQDVTVYFYHPSMRDLLVELIQNDREARKSYIQNLSLREFINLITNSDQVEKDSSLQHKISLTENEDMDLLSKYLEEKVLAPAQIKDILSVLTAIIGFMQKYGYEKLSTIGKQSLNNIATFVCLKQVWEKNYKENHTVYFVERRFPYSTVISQIEIDFWIDFLEKIRYVLTESPSNNIPEYLGEMLEHFGDKLTVSYWKLAKICESFSALVTSKYVSFDDRIVLKEKLIKNITDAVSECPNFDDEDSLDECDAWRGNYDDLHDEIKDYLRIFPEDDIESFDEFDNLIKDCPVAEREYEQDYDSLSGGGSYGGDDFDIRAVFADL